MHVSVGQKRISMGKILVNWGICLVQNIFKKSLKIKMCLWCFCKPVCCCCLWQLRLICDCNWKVFRHKYALQWSHAARAEGNNKSTLCIQNMSACKNMLSKIQAKRNSKKMKYSEVTAGILQNIWAGVTFHLSASHSQSGIRWGQGQDTAQLFKLLLSFPNFWKMATRRFSCAFRSLCQAWIPSKVE